MTTADASLHWIFLDLPVLTQPSKRLKNLNSPLRSIMGR